MTNEERLALIGLCRIEIERWKVASESVPEKVYMVELMEIALASLQAEPVDRIVDDGCQQQIGDVQVSDHVNCVWPIGLQFYTTPPTPADSDLICAINRLLDSDGSCGTFSAIECSDARQEVERLLAAAPEPGGDDE